MKLPRWLVWMLLAASFVGGVVLPAWWWKIWPGRTASAFIAAVRAGDFERANQFLVNGRRFDEFDEGMMLNNVSPRYGFAGSMEQWEEFAQPENVILHPRTLGEVLRGEQRFDLSPARVWFVAERDTIVASFDPIPADWRRTSVP